MLISLAVLLAVLGCTPPPASVGPAAEGGTESRSASANRTLVVAIHGEPASLAGRSLRAGLSFPQSTGLFNAGLAFKDQAERIHPYLSQALPALHTDSWRVLSDGQMETRYQLKPHLTWHDGAPLSAEDFVFGWRVYALPDFGVARSAPFGQITEVSAPDPATVLIRWREPYPEAAALVGSGSGGDQVLPPLPQHLLAEVFAQADHDLFLAHSYWTSAHVGLGPYRLDRWEPGTFIEATAFPGYVLGQPRIQRLQLLFVADPNTVVAGLLAGTTHLAIDDAIGFQHGMLLRREWQATGAGVVVTDPTGGRRILVQFRPEYAQPLALVDVRVRRALVHALDKRAINDGLYEGQGLLTDTLIPPDVRYAAELDRAISKYPYDGRRSEQLMAEAGFQKGPDGVYASQGERFSVQLQVTSSAQQEAEMAIVADSWRRLGFEVTERVFPAALARDGEARATFSGLFIAGGPIGEAGLRSYAGSSVPGPGNRWTGANRGGWVHAAYDAQLEAYTTTLERDRRDQQVIELMRLFTSEIPALAMNFEIEVIAHDAALRVSELSVDTVALRIHEAELR
jgi:peptide/nickel transport system substrate-binding protein